MRKLLSATKLTLLLYSYTKYIVSSFLKTNNNDAYFIGIDPPIQIKITVTFSRLYFRKLFKFFVSAPSWIIGDGTVMHLATSEGKVS